MFYFLTMQLRPFIRFHDIIEYIEVDIKEPDSCSHHLLRKSRRANFGQIRPGEFIPFKIQNNILSSLIQLFVGLNIDFVIGAINNNT